MNQEELANKWAKDISIFILKAICKMGMILISIKIVTLLIIEATLIEAIFFTFGLIYTEIYLMKTIYYDFLHTKYVSEEMEEE